MNRIFRASFLPLLSLTFAALFSSGAAMAQGTAATPDRSASYYHYSLAKMYEEQAVTNGRQDMATQAIEQYKLALDADPDSRMLQDGIANLYFRLGRIREAVSAAQDQVKKHPDDVEAHSLLGKVYLRSLGDGQGPQSTEMLKTAIVEYEKIVALKPNDLENRLLLGQLYGLNHDSAKAETQFKAAQNLDGSSEEVVLRMAQLYSEQSDFTKAAKVIADVPEDDRTARMDFALGGLYDQLNKPELAVAAYRGALDQDPDNADTKRALASALTKAGKSDEAAQIYAQILSADPQDPQALIRQAELQRQEGHYEQALATLKKASALAADNLEVNYNEALCYDALGRFDEAVSTLKSMLASTASADGKYADPDRQNRSLFLERLAIVYKYQRKTDDALDAYKQMEALGGDYRVRGTDGQVQVYRDAHDYTKALEVAAAAAKAMPKNVDAQVTYASQLADSGKVDEGLKVAESQLSGAPEDRGVWFTIADINSRAKRWKEMTAAMEKVDELSKTPQDKAALYDYRANMAEKQKLHDQAEVEYRKGLQLDPESASIENDYGYLLADRGVRLDEAVKMLKHAVMRDPQNGSFLDSLAWAYYKQGQYALAEEYARKAVARLGTDPTVMDHLGEIYAKNGKLQMAIVEWQKALKEYAVSLAPEADPVEVAKVQKKLETARVRVAHAGPAK